MRKSRTGPAAEAARPSPKPTSKRPRGRPRSTRESSFVQVSQFSLGKYRYSKGFTIYAPPADVLKALCIMIQDNGWTTSQNLLPTDEIPADDVPSWVDELSPIDSVTIPLQHLPALAKAVDHA